MQPDLSKIHYLTGNTTMLEHAPSIPAHKTWDAHIVEFLSAFSRNLLKDSRSRAYADITSYAFWIRNASLKQIKERYYSKVDDKIGRGVAFHIAPSNVPINFAVSFTSSLLAGNINIVRLSNKEFEQVNIMVDCLRNTFLEGFQDMEQYLLLIRYEHDEEITAYLSSICDVRIIWGGNQTINLVREAKLSPRAIEMSFADRYSMALINSKAVMELDNVDKLAADFYTDTYYIDQNACSSPRIVVWFDDFIAEAKERFWGAVEKLVSRDYDFRDIQAVDKLDQFCRLAAVNHNVLLANQNNMVMRIDVKAIDSVFMDYKLGGGFFFEYTAKTIGELMPILGKTAQTISFFGLDGRMIQDFIIENGVRGCDRIVPVGKTMDLSFKWDGYDMIETMSRYVYCPDYKRGMDES